jgi:hypothetical protein
MAAKKLCQIFVTEHESETKKAPNPFAYKGFGAVLFGGDGGI